MSTNTTRTDFRPTHVATLGPEDHPTRIAVERVRDSDTPSFVRVEDAANKPYTVHCMKLKPLVRRLQESCQALAFLKEHDLDD